MAKEFDQFKKRFLPHGLVYSILAAIIVTLTVLTIVYGTRNSGSHNSSNSPTIITAENRIIGYPISLPSDDHSIQWTILQMNDVYEISALDSGKKGGMARVAHIRNLLKKENPHTYTILAGDFLSPSALGLAKVNGTQLKGQQMIGTMNAIGVDYVTFGNHEFDLTEQELLARMNQSTSIWISSNVRRKNSSDLFGSSITHHILQAESVKIMLIGLTIDANDPYVDIINQSALVDYVQQFLRQFPNGTYDVLIAITHLDMQTDIQLASKVPQIDLILGGHEHENYFYLRGVRYKPIYKADANALTVYIHRCLFNNNARKFDVFSTLARIDSRVEEDNRTATVVKYWSDLGLQGFRDDGYEPNSIVACLPDQVELDGRSESVRRSVTQLTYLICESLLNATASMNTVIGIVNSGGVRIDDILRDSISQYDILRVLPFPNRIVSLKVPGEILAQVLTVGFSKKGEGMFLAYSRIETSDNGQTWQYEGNDISNTGLSYNIATLDYVRDNTQLNDPAVITIGSNNETAARGFMNYLGMIYPPCILK